MANCYILTLGKNTTTQLNTNNLNSYKYKDTEIFLKSMCYYDWIGVQSISQEDSINNLLYNARNEIENIRNFYSRCKGLHVQQNLVLLTNDEDDTLSCKEERLSFIYISFVNVFSAKKAPFLQKNKNISLYRTFDHCDYVLVADGSKLSLEEYMQTLNQLKADENVHDIISLYAYVPNSNFSMQHSVSAVVNIGDYNELTNLKIIPNTKISTLGRYDSLLVYDKISFDSLINLSEQISTPNDIYVSTKVHIGMDIKNRPPKAKSNLFEKSENINCLLCDYSERLFDYYCNRFQNSNVANTLNNASYFMNYLQHFLYETQKMIITTLKRGISQYYILSFIESFYGLMEYIDTKILNTPDDYITSLIDEQNQSEGASKIRAEAIIDIMNKFFNHMQAISTSMLHSERKFIQTDPYQLTYFDIPPKLIAFYTAIANQMVCCLKEKDKDNNKYHFLISPDFKNDIYVDCLTHNRDFENEQNILIIHINDKDIYSISNTLSTIAHEISHHVGQTVELREKRAVLCIKSLLACLLTELYSVDYTSVSLQKDLLCIFEKDNDKRSFFENLVEKFYSSIFDENLFKDNQYYYADELVEYFVNKIKEFRSSEDVIKKVTTIFTDAYDKVSLYNYAIKSNCNFLCNLIESQNIKNNNNKNAFTNNLIINMIANNFIYLLDKKIPEIECHKIDDQGNLSYPMFDHLIYVFRDGYADTQMLLLTTDCENIKDYYEEVSKLSETTLENELKKISVLKAFDATDLEFSGSTALYTCYYNYLQKNASAYFSELLTKENKQIYSQIQQIMTSICSENNSKHFIEIIDDVIENYKHRLLKFDFGITSSIEE